MDSVGTGQIYGAKCAMGCSLTLNLPNSTCVGGGIYSCSVEYIDAELFRGASAITINGGKFDCPIADSSQADGWTRTTRITGGLFRKTENATISTSSYDSSTTKCVDNGNNYWKVMPKNLTGVMVNGVDAADRFGAGWTFDSETRLLSLTAARDYVLSGANTAGAVRIEVTKSADVTLNNLCLTAETPAADLISFASGATNATLTLSGVNTVYAKNGLAAIGVAAGATLTVTGDGELVGGKSVTARGRGASVSGTLNWNGGTLRDYFNQKAGSVQEKGAGVLVTSGGTFNLNDGLLTGMLGYDGGALYNMGTVNMTGGVVSNNCAEFGSAFYCGTDAHVNVCGGAVTGNGDTDKTGILCTGTGTISVRGGVVSGNTGKSLTYECTFNLYGAVGADLATAKPASGYSVVKITDTLCVVGKDVASVDGRLAGGTFSFCPTNAEYAAAGVALAPNRQVVKQATDPATWTIKPAVMTGVTVGGRDAAWNTGDGWTFADGVLSLTNAQEYVLSGTNTAGAVRVVVSESADVTLSSLCLTAETPAADLISFASGATNATLTLSGVNTVYAKNELAAIGVAAGATLTVTGDGELVGGKAGSHLGRGASVSGTLNWTGGTMRDYFLTALFGAQEGKGAGVLVTSGGTFSLSDGLLTGMLGYDGGALYNMGTVNMTGGVVSNNCAEFGSAFYCGTSAHVNVCGGAVTGNGGEGRTGILCTGTGTISVHGGVVSGNTGKSLTYKCTFNLYGAVGADLATAKPASGYSVVKITDTLCVVGKDVASVDGRLAGGTFTFCPTNAEYVAAGVALAPNRQVVEQAGEPATYRVLPILSTVTPQAVAHASCKVYTNEVEVVGGGGEYQVAYGATVTVVYTADDGSVFAGGATTASATFVADAESVRVPAEQLPGEPLELTGVTVNGEDAAYAVGDGWANVNGEVRITKSGAYAIAGTNTAGVLNFMFCADAVVTLDNLKLYGGHGSGCEGAALFNCFHNVRFLLKGANEVKATMSGAAAIWCEDGLTTFDKAAGETDASAVLVARGAGNGAGIGSGRWQTSGVIVIDGGTIEARGGSAAAGIGSGYGCLVTPSVTINGGIVRAFGGSPVAGLSAAGIGEGAFSYFGSVTINGGYVHAVGSSGAYGDIGVGDHQLIATHHACPVTVTGGTIIANVIGDNHGSVGYTQRSVITGGSFGGAAKPTTLAPVNADGKTVWKVTVRGGWADGHAPTFVNLPESYGTNGIVAVGGAVSLWLPDGQYLFKADDAAYYAAVAGADVTATLWDKGVRANGTPLTDLAGTGWTVDVSTGTLCLDGRATNRFDLAGQAITNFNVRAADGSTAFALRSDAMIALDPTNVADLLVFALPNASRPWCDQEIAVTAEKTLSLGAGTWYLNPTGRYDTATLDCTVVADGVWRLEPKFVAVHPQTVAHTTFKVYTNEVELAGGAPVVARDATVTVVYTADDGSVFAGGATTASATFVAAVDGQQVPAEHLPGEPIALTGVKVNGTDMAVGSGPGWAFMAGLLSLTNEQGYVLSGTNTSGDVNIRVTTNATVTLNRLKLAVPVIGDSTGIRFREGASDAKLVLVGDCTLYGRSGWAVCVDKAAKVTMSGTGALVGDRSVISGCNGVFVYGTFVLDGATIRDYHYGNSGGAVACKGRFEMRSGTVTNCIAHVSGGFLSTGINWSDSSAVISGGTIVGCTSESDRTSICTVGGSCTVCGGYFGPTEGVAFKVLGRPPEFRGAVLDTCYADISRYVASDCQQVAVGDNRIIGRNVTQADGKLTGGTFTFCPTNAEYVAAGVALGDNCTVIEQAGEPTTYRVSQTVARIDEDRYETFDAALAAATNGQAITFLQSDVAPEAKSLTLGAGVNVTLNGETNGVTTLDLDGVTLTLGEGSLLAFGTNLTVMGTVKLAGTGLVDLRTYEGEILAIDFDDRENAHAIGYGTTNFNLTACGGHVERDLYTSVWRPGTCTFDFEQTGFNFGVLHVKDDGVAYDYAVTNWDATVTMTDTYIDWSGVTQTVVCCFVYSNEWDDLIYSPTGTNGIANTWARLTDERKVVMGFEADPPTPTFAVDEAGFMDIWFDDDFHKVPKFEWLNSNVIDSDLEQDLWDWVHEEDEDIRPTADEWQALCKALKEETGLEIDDTAIPTDRDSKDWKNFMAGIVKVGVTAGVIAAAVYFAPEFFAKIVSKKVLQFIEKHLGKFIRRGRDRRNKRREQRREERRGEDGNLKPMNDKDNANRNKDKAGAASLIPSIDRIFDVASAADLAKDIFNLIFGTMIYRGTTYPASAYDEVVSEWNKKNGDSLKDNRDKVLWFGVKTLNGSHVNNAGYFYMYSEYDIQDAVKELAIDNVSLSDEIKNGVKSPGGAWGIIGLYHRGELKGSSAINTIDEVMDIVLKMAEASKDHGCYDLAVSDTMTIPSGCDYVLNAMQFRPDGKETRAKALFTVEDGGVLEFQNGSFDGYKSTCAKGVIHVKEGGALILKDMICKNIVNSGAPLIVAESGARIWVCGKTQVAALYLSDAALAIGYGPHAGSGACACDLAGSVAVTGDVTAVDAAFGTNAFSNASWSKVTNLANSGRKATVDGAYVRWGRATDDPPDDPTDDPTPEVPPVPVPPLFGSRPLDIEIVDVDSVRKALIYGQPTNGVRGCYYYVESANDLQGSWIWCSPNVWQATAPGPVSGMEGVLITTPCDGAKRFFRIGVSANEPGE